MTTAGKFTTRMLLLALGALLFAAASWAAEAGGGEAGEAKQLAGMSIVGNDEAPKSLTIVPWKSSEIGVETDLKMTMQRENVLVDRDVFKRQLDFFEASQANSTGR